MQRRVPPALARSVRTQSLTPIQHTTSRSFRIAADVRLQWMVKHPHLSEFHSLAEHLYAGLLEGTPTVSAYVPQPFQLRVGKRAYKPDFYVVEGHQRRVVELKPRGEFDEALREPLEAFFELQGMRFEVVANERTYERSLEAQNWLSVARVLYQHRDLETYPLELQVLERVCAPEGLQLGELIDPGDRHETLTAEVATFRLLHRGVLKANLAEAPLDFDTWVVPT